MSYDPENIFARIIRGEIPAHKIYEDEQTMAFMDVMPQVEGHCLVVPKKSFRNLTDVDPATLSQVMATVQKIALAAQKAFKADGFQIRQYNEPAAGQTVFHLHVHILPMSAGTEIKSHSNKMAKPEVLAAQAEAIKKQLS